MESKSATYSSGVKNFTLRGKDGFLCLRKGGLFAGNPYYLSKEIVCCDSLVVSDIPFSEKEIEHYEMYIKQPLNVIEMRISFIG